MQRSLNKMLFGGALLGAGLGVQTANGEVMNEQFHFSADLYDQYIWDGTYDSYGSANYVSSGVNDSFNVIGGFEVMPIDRSGWGGTQFDYPIPLQSFHVTGAANESLDGGAYARLSTLVSPGTIYDFPSGGTPDSEASMTFTLTSAMSFELTVHRFSWDNDLGAGSLGLQEIGGSVIYTSSDFISSSTLVASGTLGPGEYRLWSNSFGAAIGDVSLLISVPAPGSAAVFAMVGMVAVRRRRHGVDRK